jgi:NitT/TauT family transport system substrate-binding protein
MKTPPPRVGGITIATTRNMENAPLSEFWQRIRREPLMTVLFTRKRFMAALAVSCLALASCGPKTADKAAPAASPRRAAKSEYKIGWTIYAGWMPWAYAQQSGIVKKWADKYGVKIELVQINDYVESLNQYSAGKLDGVTATNMDALTVPAAAGKDTTVVMIGDYSDGNDGVILKNGTTLADLKGRPVNLVELSVSTTCWPAPWRRPA